MEFWKDVWEFSIGMGFGMFAYIYLTVLIKGVPEVLETLGICKPKSERK